VIQIIFFHFESFHLCASNFESLNNPLIACAHCGDPCEDERIHIDENAFCCEGCKTVFQILSDSELSDYYDIEDLPGISPKGHFKGRFGFLDEAEVEDKILRYKDDQISMVEFRVPQIHCSSCIWLLENLDRVDDKIIDGQVNFPRKTVRIRFQNTKFKLGELADLLASLGYEPDVNLGDLDNERVRPDRKLTYQLGVAGFCFGNIMLFAFPEYFALEGFWIDKFGPFFRWLSLGLSLPIFFYSAQGYFSSAIKGLRRKYISIDVPIALGMLVLFGRSVYEVAWDVGTGYFDSLAGLVFFLLLGKLFQSRTYAHLNFERDYKAYFPIAVHRLEDGESHPIAVNLLNENDVIIIRHGELIPCDAQLIHGQAFIDNSFVTGESNPLEKKVGEKIFAGGRQMGGKIELKVLRTVSQSYLTQLWNHTAFTNDRSLGFKNLTDKVSKYFTVIILLLALVSAAVWIQIDAGRAAQVVTAILIVACPCALALSAPFALGNMSRLMGLKGFYLKNPEVIERIAEINHFAFDKTSTITLGSEADIEFIGEALSSKDQAAIKSLFEQSNHPMSRWIDQKLEGASFEVADFKEVPGKGIQAIINGSLYKAGSPSFLEIDHTHIEGSQVFVKKGDHSLGYFELKNKYRSELVPMVTELTKIGEISVLTGDNSAEDSRLKNLFGQEADLHFRLSPEDKLEYIERLQAKKKKVLMLGDGLNDAGALKQSNVGVSISENLSSFAPSSDAILDALVFHLFPDFIQWSKKTRKVILWSFGISFSYNIVGLMFAVSGQLSPVVAAILMPLSSVSVVGFTTLATNLISGRRKKV